MADMLLHDCEVYTPATYASGYNYRFINLEAALNSSHPFIIIRQGKNLVRIHHDDVREFATQFARLLSEAGYRLVP